MNSILLRDVIAEMDRIDGNGKPVPFSAKFVTADRKRRTGGEIISVENAVKCIGKRKGEVVYDGRTDQNRIRRDPHHYENATRNIMLENSVIRKLHIRLILEFNGKKVLY